MDMKPISLVKRPNLESPDKLLKRQVSDVSIPPSFRVMDETTQQVSFDQKKVTKKPYQL